MKRFLLFGCLLVLRCLTCQAQQPNDMIIAGTLINNSTFLPVPNYPLVITADSLLPALNVLLNTDANGNFYFLVNNGSLAGQDINYRIETYGCNQSFSTQTGNGSGSIDSSFSSLNVCIGSSGPCSNGFNFYNNPYSPAPGLFVFTDTSNTSGTNFWQWEFSNGSSIAGTNESIINYMFPATGVFEVCLTTLHSDGCLQTSCDSVISGAPGSCLANVSVITDTANNSAVFTCEIIPGSTPQINSFTLYFGDGDSLHINSSLSPISLIHQYDTLGIYNATVSIINAAGCADFVNIIVDFNAIACLADFSFSQVSSPPGSVSFTNNSSPGAISYSWDFGDNTPADTATSPLHVYAASGTYNVCLTTTYPNGCFDIYCSIVNVSFTPSCLAQYTWFANTQAGPNGIQLQNLSSLPSGGTFSFNAGDGSPTFILPTQVYLYNYPTPGTYYACLTINGPNCTASYCDSIIVLSSGCTANLYASQIVDYTATFNSSFNPFITGDTITVEYDYGDGNQDTLEFYSNNITNPYSFQQAGTYQVCANMVSSSGCVALVCTTLTINPLCDAYFNYSVDNTGPSGTYVLEDSSFSPSIITNWTWNINGNPVAGTDSISYTFPNVGINNVCLTINTIDGCQDIYCDSILYSPVLGCDLLLDSLTVPFTLPGLTRVYFNYSPFINGETLTYEYNWGDGSSNSGVLGQTANALALHPYLPGNYNACLKVTNTAGCTDSICLNINYQPNQLALEIRLRDVLSNYLNDMTIYIMQYDSSDGKLTTIDTSWLSNSTNVYYKNLPFGNYLIKGDLDQSNSLSENYLPTYFGEHLYWNGGVLIHPAGVSTNLNSDYFPAYIDLISGIVPAGPGSISGFIHEDINNPSGPVLPGIDILLLSEQGVAIAHTKTNASGAYSFANLPFGSYYIYPELINHFTYPVKVVLNNAQSEAEQVNLGIDRDIIQQLKEGEGVEFAMYPNPAGNLVNIVTGKKTRYSSIGLYSAIGQLVLQQEVSVGEKFVSIDVSTLPAGLYWVKPEGSSPVRVEKLMISR